MTVQNFGELPSSEARSYGDRKFVAMMFAKVVCVQIVNYMGYDLLFQDVDVIWYKNPLDWFHDKNNPYHGFDMYYQDDGAHSVRYAPYSANSGFYFVRSNELTKYFFTSLLYHNDEIISSTSHQQALIQLMADHASKFGTRVKVLDREMMEFPGGWHYHNRPKRPYMKAVMSGEVEPYIFHMSWTKNKDNKIKFFQQMGEWYLADQCIGHTKEEIFQVAGISDEGATLFQPCCLAEPNIICHYRDKPSKIPCKDAPPIDKGAKSFW
jgi:signal peptidase I